MQPTAPKHRSSASGRSGGVRQRGRHVSSYGDGFGRFAGLTTLALVPGAGLLAVGRRRLGLLLLLATALVVAALAVFGLSGGGVVQRVLSVAVSPGRLLFIAGAAILVGLVWAVTILVTAWHARPDRPTPFQGLVGLGLVAALCAAVVAPTAKGAELAMVQRDLVTSVFGATGGAPRAAGAARPKNGSDPWKGIPRLNLLLLGSDAGKDRVGVRTDSMMVASINTKTGDTVLIGLPRNLQRAPFPESNPLHKLWPNGFDCSDCLLNAVWQQAAAQHPDLFPGNPNPGLTSTRDVISNILGLRIDAYATVDLRGFQSLVDAMGGVDVNVPRDLPIGGKDSSGRRVPISGYVKAGHRHLNGYEALWFSRSRLDSDDYDRMRRQRCMVGNLVRQVNPVKLLSKYGQLAKVLKQNVETDISQDQLQAWVVLVQRMQKGKITSLPLTNKVINTVHPDFPAIREYVQKAINAPHGKPSGSTTTAAGSGSTSTPTSSSSTPSASRTSESSTAQDVSSVC